jgi:hypothetical protein
VKECWRRRYRAAVRRLRQAEIHTSEDASIGEETYVNLRTRWDRFIRAMSQHMAYRMDVIDPASANPAEVEERQEFHTRLRSAG